MKKEIIQLEKEASEEAMISKIRQALGKNCSCFVLIACSAPSKDGKMDVKMHFDGDEALASFLVDNASQVFEERSTQRESK